ncbi:hypothetical protein MLD38_010506 [Melastoma candidum]|uniref:Uncharacterized protein n=1 Tax=Melastoma candidum TaxID=119954 RepID=A0ACB9QZN4_9MYRT|nr:hypothetical protein MLD38_010506 [Melastoma candidum]
MVPEFIGDQIRSGRTLVGAESTISSVASRGRGLVLPLKMEERREERGGWLSVFYQLGCRPELEGEEFTGIGRGCLMFVASFGISAEKRQSPQVAAEWSRRQVSLLLRSEKLKPAVIRGSIEGRDWDRD